MEYICLGIIFVLAILGGSYSKANTRRKRDRMLNDMYDEHYKKK